MAGVDTGVTGKKGIQSTVAGRIEEAVGTALRNGRQVRSDDGEEIEETVRLVKEGALIDAVEDATGQLRG